MLFLALLCLRNPSLVLPLKHGLQALDVVGDIGPQRLVQLREDQVVGHLQVCLGKTAGQRVRPHYWQTEKPRHAPDSHGSLWKKDLQAWFRLMFTMPR